MKCPFCGSDNYDFINVDDFDECETKLHFQCLGKCGKHFYGIYLFDRFENEDGYLIGD